MDRTERARSADSALSRGRGFELRSRTRCSDRRETDERVRRRSIARGHWSRFRRAAPTSIERPRLETCSVRGICDVLDTAAPRWQHVDACIARRELQEACAVDVHDVDVARSAGAGRVECNSLGVRRPRRVSRAQRWFRSERRRRTEKRQYKREGAKARHAIHASPRVLGVEGLRVVEGHFRTNWASDGPAPRSPVATSRASRLASPAGAPSAGRTGR